MATYYEVIIKGDDERVRAYLKGYFAGRGDTSGFYFSRDWPFHLRHIRDLVKYRGGVVHLICVASFRPVVASAIRKAEAILDIDIVDTHKIKEVSFGFDFETANRKAAGAIKRALGRLPAGVGIRDFDPDEVVHPSGRGVEAYAPLHEYVFKGAGVVAGDVAGVLRVRERLSRDANFRLEEIDIHT